MLFILFLVLNSFYYKLYSIIYKEQVHTRGISWSIVHNSRAYFWNSSKASNYMSNDFHLVCYEICENYVFWTIWHLVRNIYTCIWIMLKNGKKYLNKLLFIFDIITLRKNKLFLHIKNTFQIFIKNAKARKTQKLTYICIEKSLLIIYVTNWDFDSVFFTLN